jgi:hypothetical protein
MRSQSPALDRITRAFALFSARTDTLSVPFHIPGVDNVQADALSRGSTPLEFQRPGWRRVRPHPLLIRALLEGGPVPPAAEWFAY